MAKPLTGRTSPKPSRAVARPITAAREPGLAPQRTRPIPKTDPIKVRATQMGYYDHLRRRVGDVFVIAKPSDFSKRWMERVDPETPERTTSAPEALRAEHDKILGGVVTGGEDVFSE